MTESVRVAQLQDIPPGSCLEVAAAGRVVALFNVDGSLYAVDGVCPHAGGPLGAGTLQDNVVTCPWHGWQFDVTNGRHCLNDNIQHPTFAVRVEDNTVYVELPGR
jgi:nitrite reductase/ring-hydroxylating ferredoxin subunit